METFKSKKPVKLKFFVIFYIAFESSVQLYQSVSLLKRNWILTYFVGSKVSKLKVNSTLCIEQSCSKLYTFILENYPHIKWNWRKWVRKWSLTIVAVLN